MSYHHLAIATRDMPATHAFYSEAMGFELVRVEKAVMGPTTWAKHFFYDTGNGEMMAFWEIHDEELGDDYPTSISAGLGLPPWSNHIAFGAESIDDLHAKRQGLLNAGYPVTEIDHDWCRSIYANDPNGILVEFCVTTRAFTEEDKEIALRAVTSDDLDPQARPVIEQFTPDVAKNEGAPLG